MGTKDNRYVPQPLAVRWCGSSLTAAAQRRIACTIALSAVASSCWSVRGQREERYDNSRL